MVSKSEINRAVKEFEKLFKRLGYDEDYTDGDKIWVIHDAREEAVYIFTVAALEAGDASARELYPGIQNITMGKIGNAFIGWGGESVPYRIAEKLTRMYEKDSDVDYKASRMEIEGTGYLVWN